MLVIGLVCIVLGWLLGIGFLVTIGMVLAIVGVILFAIGATGSMVGGRKHWY
jgi:hypothetical protein